MLQKLALVVFAILSLTIFGFAQSDIRKVDFNNFTFEPSCAGEETKKVTVKNGEFSEEKKVDDYVDRFYFHVFDFVYGDVNGDGKEDVIISSVCNTGGTGNFTEGFIYTIHQGKPILIGLVEGGDRAYGGLRKIEIENGVVAVDRNDAGEMGGACCPEFAVKTKYKWDGKELKQFGTEERRELYPKKRVSFAKGATSTIMTIKVDEISRFVIGARAGQTLKVTVNSDKVSASLFEGEADVTEGEKGFTAVLQKSGDFVIQLQNMDEKESEVSVTIEIR
ncbi:MAG: hypothetical protein K1X72_15700 [Pyrinomonadaceae bacterium]|nr:hypothetical protein [Pyrinomonadaceae bacterium]